jgi:hypothetical protein
VLEQLCDVSGHCDAFDVFEEQFKNLDQSGKGSKDKFLKNVTSYAQNARRVRAFQGDSMDLAAGVSEYPRDVTYDLFSVDGAHTPLHTCNDLNFAGRVVSPGGVVILDDINNLSWMGVIEGACRYLQGPAPRLAPFAVGLNKLLMTPVGNQARYFEYFKQHRDAKLTAFAPAKSTPVTQFHGYSVLRYA